WLLLDDADTQSVAAAELTAVERELARDHPQQRRLAGAIAADQADAFPAAHRQVGAVEQWVQPEGEFGVGEGEQRHEAREHGTVVASLRGPARGYCSEFRNDDETNCPGRSDGTRDAPCLLEAGTG